MRKPSVNTNPVANRYSSTNERIIEFSGPTGAGGLISLTANDDGTLTVDLYRLDADVCVNTPRHG